MHYILRFKEDIHIVSSLTPKRDTNNNDQNDSFSLTWFLGTFLSVRQSNYESISQLKWNSLLCLVSIIQQRTSPLGNAE